MNPHASRLNDPEFVYERSFSDLCQKISQSGNNRFGPRTWQQFQNHDAARCLWWKA